MNAKNKIYHVIFADTGEIKMLKGSYYVRPNFQIWEFACKDGNEVIVLNNKSLDKLQKIRTRIKRPIKIVSAFRTYSYNKKIGGAQDSRHLHGDAYDLEVPKTFTLKGFTKIVEEEFGYDSGVSMYPSSNTKFVHADTRGWHWRGIDGNTKYVDKLVP